MARHATPNLPSRGFEAASRFHATLGFAEGWRDEGWMIGARVGALVDPDGSLVRLIQN